MYYSQLHPEDKRDIGKESRHKWSHQNQNEETRFFLDLGAVWYTRGLNRQAEVLRVRELVEVTDADEGGLAGEEGLGGLLQNSKHMKYIWGTGI